MAAAGRGMWGTLTSLDISVITPEEESCGEGDGEGCGEGDARADAAAGM